VVIIKEVPKIVLTSNYNKIFENRRTDMDKGTEEG